MNQAEFLEELEVVLDEDAGTLAPATLIADIEGWDSTGLLSVIALLDGDLGVHVNIDTLRACKTLADLIALLGDTITESN
ncbi:MAG: acyl carrier protein [Phycisphaerales bacterium]|jgi:acyl carrier protein|nr:acyl carrier protein [Phycisphaerales bacterium]MBT7170699.1 acyl carrier protein [Phycisphaerales bacterium]